MMLNLSKFVLRVNPLYIYKRLSRRFTRRQKATLSGFAFAIFLLLIICFVGVTSFYPVSSLSENTSIANQLFAAKMIYSP